MTNEIIVVKGNLSQEQAELVKRTICKGATDDELQMFIGVCNRTGLDPFARQIYAVKRYSKKEKKEVMSIQISIDGSRLIAQRSNEYEGQTPAEWCGKDGVWKQLWVSKEMPFAARVGVWRKNFREPCFAVAIFDSYAQKYDDGNLMGLWAQFPELMISKCAEALALRKAFPQELSGLYTMEEMGQAENKIKPAEIIREDYDFAITKDATNPNNGKKLIDHTFGELDDLILKVKTETQKQAVMAIQLERTDKILQSFDVDNKTNPVSEEIIKSDLGGDWANAGIMERRAVLNKIKVALKGAR